MLRKIKRTIQQRDNDKRLALYTSLYGSIITSYAILHNKNEEWAYRYFNKLKKDKSFNPNTIKEAVEYIFGDDDKKELLILLTDKDNIRSPLVTIGAVYEDGAVRALPLDKNGIGYGLIGLFNEGRENANCEFIFG